MKEIPIPYVRVNQAFMAVLIACSFFLKVPWLIVAVFAVELTALITGIRGNLFIQLAKPFLGKWLSGANTEASELLRFNTSIAVALLALSVISFSFGFQTLGFIFAIMVAIAAFAAICGYCIGCTLYYQFKKLRSK